MTGKYMAVPQEDMPYIIVSATAIPKPKHSITLTAAGIKELAKRTKNTDLVRIEQWEDFNDECSSSKLYQQFVILRDTEVKHENV